MLNNVETALHNILHGKFGYDSFRTGQLETLKSVLSCQPTLAILPTGSGKSLLYQLPAYLLNGLVIVVSPLISLMQDQVNRIRENGDFKVATLNSTLDYRERRSLLNNLHRYKFLFVAPETLVKKEVIKRLKNIPLAEFVIDEAHCISQWGPDFRPEYLDLGVIIGQLHPRRLLMLTATATPTTERDIITKLNLSVDSVKIIRRPVDRPNIFLAVKKLTDEDSKKKYLLDIIKQLGSSGIVYLSSRKVADNLADWLTQRTTMKVVTYHAGLSDIERFRIQQSFMEGRIDLICATSAFGMGINKNNIRYVIHYHMPTSMESYVQEIGRVGRDNQPALALLLYAPGDEMIAKTLVSEDLPSVQVIEAVLGHQLPKTSLGPQADVLMYYLKDHDPAETIAILESQEKINYRRIQKMLNYINSASCYRQEIAQYFGEQVNAIPQNCCSVHDPEWQIDQLEITNVNNSSNSQNKDFKDWPRIIKNLFNQ